MKQQLIQYVELLFAGAPDSGEIKQEILQNTLDRYDDLIAQGKSPEAAYRLAIGGIGDINEILGSTPSAPLHSEPVSQPKEDASQPTWQKRLKAIAIGLYIIAILPLIVLSEAGLDTLGLCATVSIVAVATVAIIVSNKESQAENPESTFPPKPTQQQELRDGVRGIIWAVGLAVYFIVSFLTGAWYITWVLFPIIGSVQGLVIAIMDLREANKHET